MGFILVPLAEAGGCALLHGFGAEKLESVTGRAHNLSWNYLLQPNGLCAQPRVELSASQAFCKKHQKHHNNLHFSTCRRKLFNWNISNSSIVNQLFQNESKLKQSQRSWTEKMGLREGGLRPSSYPRVKHLQTAKFPNTGDEFSSQPLGCLRICHHLWVFLPNRKNKISESNQVANFRFPVRNTKTIIYTSSFKLLLSGCSRPSLETVCEGWPRRNILRFAASGHSVQY